MKTARFLVFVNGALVKMDLKPGQTLSHYTSGSHDEGWGSESTTWSYDIQSESILREWCIDGSDCDGRMTRTGTDSCTIDLLASYKTTYGDLLPRWEKVNRRQRDYFAESMGY